MVSQEDLAEDGGITPEDMYMEMDCASSLEVDAVIDEFTHQSVSDGEEAVVDTFQVQGGPQSEETGEN